MFFEVPVHPVGVYLVVQVPCRHGFPPRLEPPQGQRTEEDHRHQDQVLQEPESQIAFHMVHRASQEKQLQEAEGRNDEAGPPDHGELPGALKEAAPQALAPPPQGFCPLPAQLTQPPGQLAGPPDHSIFQQGAGLDAAGHTHGQPQADSGSGNQLCRQQSNEEHRVYHVVIHGYVYTAEADP